MIVIISSLFSINHQDHHDFLIIHDMMDRRWRPPTMARRPCLLRYRWGSGEKGEGPVDKTWDFYGDYPLVN